jgi:hypothetical protein
MSVESKLQELDGRSMVLSEGVASSDGTLEDGMIEVDFVLSSSGEDVVVEQLVGAGSSFRIPRKGEVALLGFVDGDRNEGYILGWISKPDASPSSSRVEAGALYLFPPEGESVIVISDDVKLGSELASQAVALAPLVEALLSSRDAVYGSHFHTIPTPLITIPVPIPTSSPLPSTLGSGSVGATKVTAE